MDDIDVFLQAMQEVTPLEDNTIAAKITDAHQPLADLNGAARRSSATALDTDPNFLIHRGAPPVFAFDPLSFRRDGVQRGVFRRLRRGHYAIGAALDLHRHRVFEARRALYEFIGQSYELDLRCVLVVHGKGLHGQQGLQYGQHGLQRGDLEKPAIIKSYVASWLIQFPQVLAYHSAIKCDGGLGAVYVMIKKSERAKQKTRRQYPA